MRGREPSYFLKFENTAQHKDFRYTIPFLCVSLYMRHSLSNIDLDNKIATCSVCGENTPLSVCRNSPRCKNKKNEIQRVCQRRRQLKGRSDNWRIAQTKCTWRARTGREFSTEEILALKAVELCACCGRSKSEVGTLNLDHCHATNRIRAMLCRGCNRGIGFFDDSPDRLRLAAIYLEKFSK